MAFPFIVTTGSTANLSVTGSASLTAPSSIVAGNLLLLLVQCTGVNGYSVSGAGTLLGFSADSSAASVLACYVKAAAGGDTATITPGDASAHSAAAFWHQIAGWSGNLSDITLAANNPGTTALGSLDPPNLSAAFTRDNLWFAAGAGTGAPSSITAAPTNYSGLTVNGYGSNAGTLCYATRNLNASSENPGTFTGSLQARINMTVCVAPYLFQAPPVRQTPIVPRLRAANW